MKRKASTTPQRCEGCSKTFFRRSSLHRFCHECSYLKCLDCRKRFYVNPIKQHKHTGLCPKCYWKRRKLIRHESVRKYVLMPVKENGVIRMRQAHRVVMERTLGRRLRRHELVHHIDGDVTNNDIKNLAIMSRAEHTGYHMRQIAERLKQK